MKRRLARNIADAIAQSGLTVAEVARQTGGHEKSVRRWRSGDVSPSQENLAALATVLGKDDLTWFYLPHDERSKEAA